MWTRNVTRQNCTAWNMIVQRLQRFLAAINTKLAKIKKLLFFYYVLLTLTQTPIIDHNLKLLEFQKKLYDLNVPHYVSTPATLYMQP